MDDLPDRLVFFDGECALCNRSVQWLMEQDAEGRLSYAPLGGETFAALREEGAITDEHLGGQSMILAERNEEGCWSVRMRSDAVLRALECTEGAPLRAKGLRLIPRPLREWGYRLVAKSRYAVFGKTERCVLPGPGVAARVLP